MNVPEIPSWWDGESYCVRPDCHEPALYQRPWGMAGDTPIIELVCGHHLDDNE